MARTARFRQLLRTLHRARDGDPDVPYGRDPARVSRRTVLAGMAAAGMIANTGWSRRAWGKPKRDPGTVVIVGAGLAGLVCADTLRRRGVRATIYEGSSRIGGRCFSLAGVFPGQVAERGGEFVDTTHTTMLSYAKEFGLAREDVGKSPGEVFYVFGDRLHPEATVVEEYRALVAAMRADVRTLSREPTAAAHTPADAALDATSLAEYLESRGAQPVVRAAIEAAYLAEYGLETTEQSCLNFLLFIHADRRSKFRPFGVFSDERWHVIDGMERIAERIAARLPGPIVLGHRLVRVRRTPAGWIELTLLDGSRARVVTADQVVLTVPFSTLREVELDPSLGIPPAKLRAIRELGYGTNAKTMIGFDGPYWRALGGTGVAYTDLPNVQTTWETNPARATTQAAILTDYSGGHRGARLDPRRVQQEAARFLGDLERVFPGASAAASRTGRAYRVHLEHWPSNPWVKGSYTCYRPGQFTTIAGLEGESVGNLHFAGEHTNSFYEWQGFMEGAALSGIDAAAAVLGRA